MFKFLGDLYYKASGLDKIQCSYPHEKSTMVCPSPRFVIVFWHSPMTNLSIYVPILVHALRYDTDSANYIAAMLQQSGDEGYVVYENSFEQCEHRMSLIDMVIGTISVPSFAYAMRKV
jgi:hypothetical protein